eukprot:TRINITY_DN8778_c0_g1_i6.p1 TRINITY_DN8778_c0_g1~~TRINITY_DN8778_c0_g1_i6.p1  ORF type:complete len:453 (+),score=83.21 TRINITY_DN8778_c0_g1_i6:196-1554(+)
MGIVHNGVSLPQEVRTNQVQTSSACCVPSVLLGCVLPGFELWPTLGFLASGVFMVRLAVLYIDANVTANNCKVHAHVVKHLSKRKIQQNDQARPSVDPKRSKWARFRRCFQDMYYFLIVFCLITLLDLPLVVSQLVVGGGSLPRTNITCKDLVENLASYIQLAEFVLEVCVTLGLVFKIRHIKENLGITKECLTQVVVVVFGVSFFVPTNLNRNIKLQSQSRFCNMFHFNGYNLMLYFVPQFMFVLTILLYPVLLSYNFISALCSRNFKAESSSLETFTSQDPHSDLEALLSFDEGVEFFKKRLQSEFSVENMLFWDAVNMYRQGLMDAHVVYENYIDFESPMAINISAASRSALSKFFNGGKVEIETTTAMMPIKPASNFSEEEVTALSLSGSWSDPSPLLLSESGLFDEAYKEIFALMARDSFLRFSTTAEFQEFWRKHKDKFKGRRSMK